VSLNASLVMDDDSYKYDDFKINYLVNNDLPIEKVVTKKFDKNSLNSFSFGYVKSVWIKFNISNNSSKSDFILTLNETFYEKADLYLFSNNRWIKQQNGLRVPIEKREFKHNTIAYKIQLPKNSSNDFYIRLETKYPYFGKIALYQEDFFELSYIYGSNSLNMFILGISFVIMLFSFFMFRELKEKIYLYYSSYLFFNIVYLTNMSGLLVYAGLEEYIYKLHFATCFFIAFLWLFSLEYLEIKKEFKRLGNFFVFMSGSFFVLGFYTLFDYQAELMNSYSFLAVNSMLLVSIYLFFKGNVRAKYFFYAIIIYLLAGFVYLAMLESILPYNFMTRYSMVIATGLENLIFLLILTKRYKKITEENEEILEKKILQRTQELEYANSEKTLLFKELYHRVKNNFHMIIAMLWMENKKNKNISPILHRIEAMSLVNEYLYRSEDLSSFDMKKYLDDTVKSFVDNDKVSISLDYKLHCSLDKNNATNLAMITNELVTNSIKHNKLDVPHIDIILKNQGDLVTLIIQDNGKGKDLKCENGTGLDMVEDFCKQLPNSTYTFKNQNGLRFELSYKELS
jgi:two-component sensor histidine kinase